MFATSDDGPPLCRAVLVPVPVGPQRQPAEKRAGHARRLQAHANTKGRSSARWLARRSSLPFFLFSAIAGQLADKYDKAFIAERLKLMEIPVAVHRGHRLFIPKRAAAVRRPAAVRHDQRIFRPRKVRPAARPPRRPTNCPPATRSSKARRSSPFCSARSAETSPRPATHTCSWWPSASSCIGVLSWAVGAA